MAATTPKVTDINDKLNKVGVTDGSTAPAGEVGEFKSAALSSSIATITANTYLDTGLALTLEAGSWLVGYNIAVGVGDISAPSTTVNGNLALTDSSNNIQGNMVGYVGAVVHDGGDSDNVNSTVARTTVLNIAATTTYKVRVRCSVTNTIGAITVFNDSITGSLSNPDNNSVLWAVRIR